MVFVRGRQHRLKPDKPTPEQYPAGIKETGQYPEGASPAGAVDMIGNAWEWVADEIKVYPGNTESTLDLEPGVTYRVIRGGATTETRTRTTRPTVDPGREPAVPKGWIPLRERREVEEGRSP